VVPSTVRGLVIWGRAEVGAIFFAAPRPKVILSASSVAFASRMACRSEPGPESAVLVTVMSAARAGPAPTNESAHSSASVTANYSPTRDRPKPGSNNSCVLLPKPTCTFRNASSQPTAGAESTHTANAIFIVLANPQRLWPGFPETVG
jgi:hypothetical protein